VWFDLLNLNTFDRIPKGFNLFHYHAVSNWTVFEEAANKAEVRVCDLCEDFIWLEFKFVLFMLKER
jgi:hypothetical protein